MGDEKVNALLQIIHYEQFDNALLKCSFDSAKDCKDMVQCNKEKFMTENGFENCALQKHVSPLTKHAAHCEWNAIKVFHNRLSSCRPEPSFCSVQHSILLYNAPGKPEPQSVYSPTVSTTHFNRTSWKITTKECTSLMFMMVQRPRSSALLKFILTKPLRNWKTPHSLRIPYMPYFFTAL